MEGRLVGSSLMRSRGAWGSARCWGKREPRTSTPITGAATTSAVTTGAVTTGTPTTALVGAAAARPFPMTERGEKGRSWRKERCRAIAAASHAASAACCTSASHCRWAASEAFLATSAACLEATTAATAVTALKGCPMPFKPLESRPSCRPWALGGWARAMVGKGPCAVDMGARNGGVTMDSRDGGVAARATAAA